MWWQRNMNVSTSILLYDWTQGVLLFVSDKHESSGVCCSVSYFSAEEILIYAYIYLMVKYIIGKTGTYCSVKMVWVI